MNLNFESNRTITKAKVLAYVRSYFGSDLRSLVSNPSDRAILYHSATMYAVGENANEKMFRYLVESFVYEHSHVFSKKDFEKAKYWAAQILKEQNYMFTASQIMKAFSSNLNILHSNNTDTGTIIAGLFDAGIEPEKIQKIESQFADSMKKSSADEELTHSATANL